MKKTFLYMIAAALTAVSCNEIRIEEPVKYGTLSISLAGEPSVDVVTKTDGALSSEQAAGYNIAVYNNAGCTGSPVFGPKKYSSLGSEPIVLAEGNYYVWAESCDTSDAESGNGCIRLEGKSEQAVQVKAGFAADASVTCYVANAKISVTFDASVDDKFGGNELTVTFIGSDPERTVTATKDSKGPFWFNAGQIVKYTISDVNFTYVSDCSIKIDKDKNPVALAPKDNFELKISVSESADGTLSLTPSVNKTVEKAPDITAGFNPYN